jgi:hypothetical protein
MASLPIKIAGLLKYKIVSLFVQLIVHLVSHAFSRMQLNSHCSNQAPKTDQGKTVLPQTLPTPIHRPGYNNVVNHQ